MRALFIIMIVPLTTLCFSFNYLHEDFEGPIFPPNQWAAKTWVNYPDQDAEWDCVQEPDYGFNSYAALGHTWLFYDQIEWGQSRLILLTSPIDLNEGDALEVKFRYTAVQTHYYLDLSKVAVELRKPSSLIDSDQLTVVKYGYPYTEPIMFDWTTMSVPIKGIYYVMWSVQCTTGSTLLPGNELWFYLDDVKITKVSSRSSTIETKSLGEIKSQYR
jgi:hypothetical protein